MKRPRLAGLLPALLSTLTTRRTPPTGGRHTAVQPGGPKHRRHHKTRRQARDA
ncbi:hypothetical protein [Micromonospora sp. RP3T]|uniref:hypothetical protein n=1 Tax=Micromonospora sp. RP3T TaxID=2135446 RepID=UPI003D71A98F